MPRAQARVTTNHDEIRRWAEERDAAPACVRGTGGNGDIGMLRLDFPGYSGQESLQHISWDEWFRKFDERHLALLLQDQTARGEKSNFNKLIARETAKARAAGNKKFSRRHQERSRAAKSRRAGAARATSARRKKPPAKPSAAARTSASSRTARTTRRASASRRSSAGRNAERQNSTAARKRASGAPRSSAGRAAARVLTDRDEIRRWAETRGAQPACVRRTGSRGDIGMIRLDFPGYSGARSLQPISWNDWFDKFEESNLALLVQEQTARGQQSNFNKLVGRETAQARARGVSKASRRHPERAAISGARTSRGKTGTKKPVRGSTRARRTESAHGRNQSRRRAA